MKNHILLTLLVCFLNTKLSFSQELSSFYDSKTLLIQVDRKEILKEPKWQKHGKKYDDFLGVNAYSNRYRGYYQCTELAHRFLNEKFGVITKVGNGMGNANTIVQGFYSRFGNKTFSYQSKAIQLVKRSQGALEPPTPGSILNFNIGRQGHVAVVRYVEVKSANSVRVYLIEQHGYPKLRAGDKHPIRSVLFNRVNGRWYGATKSSLGSPISWLNYRFN